MTDTDRPARPASLTISISSDFRFTTRYFVDLRMGGRQVARHMDRVEVLDYIESTRKSANKHGIVLTVRDTTDELGI